MKKCDCDLCKFENPKVSTAAVIIRDQKLLVAKRVEEPFKGKWDFMGGYMQKNETPEETLKREIKEICDRVALAPLLSKTDYMEYVQENTNLDLKEQTVDNLTAIKERLLAL